MKKIYMIPIFAVAIFCLVTVSAFIVIDGGYLLDRDEMAGVTDQVIANYMVNEFQYTKAKVMEDKFIIYYNITYVEPNTYFDNSTNETVEGYKVFTQLKPFIVQRSLYDECLSKTSASNCVNILVMSDTPFEYTNDDNETITIESTYYKARQEQLRQYERAKKVRDNAIENKLDELLGGI